MCYLRVVRYVVVTCVTNICVTSVFCSVNRSTNFIFVVNKTLKSQKTFFF